MITGVQNSLSFNGLQYRDNKTQVMLKNMAHTKDRKSAIAEGLGMIDKTSGDKTVIISASPNRNGFDYFDICLTTENGKNLVNMGLFPVCSADLIKTQFNTINLLLKNSLVELQSSTDKEKNIVRK